MKSNQIFKSMALIAGMFCFQSFIVGDDTMTKENGTYVINTTTIGKDIEGYNGPTPLKVYIKKNKVERIEFLKSMESPKYYGQVKKALLEKWNGEGCQDATSGCCDWCHILFRGRHPERADGTRLLSEEQINNKRSSQGSAYYL